MSLVPTPPIYLYFLHYKVGINITLSIDQEENNRSIIFIVTKNKR